MDLTKTKYQWMVTDRWDVLHYVADLLDWDDKYWELHEAQFDNEHRWTTACGVKETLAAPGLFSRIGRPRCEKCCKVIGITPGDGCPVNDDTCKLIYR